VLHSSEVEFFLCGSKITELFGALAIACHNESLAARHLFEMKVLELSCSEQYLGRHEELKIVHSVIVFKIILCCFVVSIATLCFLLSVQR